MFITITGFQNYFGKKPFKVGSILKLSKEPDNKYDDEAIAVLMRHAGKIGYVANNVNTVARGTMSAGRIYDKIINEDYAIVKFITSNEIIAKILENDEIDELRKDPHCDINFMEDL